MQKDEVEKWPGEELGQGTLQAVAPREVVRLNKTIACPAHAFRVSLCARDSDGENRGFLGKFILQPR